MAMRSEYDGQLVEYLFGDTAHRSVYVNGSQATFTVKATSLARAIRAFRVGTLWPHAYTDGPIATEIMGDRGYDDKVYLSSEEGSVVIVQAKVRIDRSTKWIEVARIPPEVDGEDFSMEMLPMAARMQLQLGVEQSDETAIATATVDTGMMSMGRTQMQTRQMELQRALGELELQKRQLQLQVQAMKAELEKRMERIWMIELFLGSKEEVVQLRAGTPAPASDPITVRQRALCMDEEIVLHDWLNNPERIGEFDYEDIEAFDAWLLNDESAIERILPWNKGIVGLRVRREAKSRPHLVGLAGAFEKIAKEEADSMTYLLVKNGENLYRLWVDVQLFPRFFASVEDYDDLTRKHDWSHDERKAKDRMKTYFAGLLVVQGLVERSDLFHPLSRSGISVFDAVDVGNHFQLVRDDEGLRQLADPDDPLAHVTWKSYEKWLQSKIDNGVHVMWAREGYDSEDTLKSRTDIGSIYTWPSKHETYVVSKKDDRAHYGATHSFLYLPDEVIYRPWPEEDTPRTKRVRFDCYESEIVPIDFVSARVHEHLISDPNQRVRYGYFATDAWRWYKLLAQQRIVEKPFIDLVLKESGFLQTNEPQRARAERLLRWWKMKTKTHRDLGEDEPKALRMVVRAMRKGEDLHDDPERALFGYHVQALAPGKVEE